jgi:hypothetical protein
MLHTSVDKGLMGRIENKRRRRVEEGIVVGLSPSGLKIEQKQ